MDESNKKLMKEKQGFIQLLILGAATVFLVAGVFIYKTTGSRPDTLGAIPSTVSSSTTINTLYTEVNNLVGFVRSSTSTLGVFGTLSTTTGNLIIASTSGGWVTLSVGTDAYVLVASSTEQSGVAWHPVAVDLTNASATRLTVATQLVSYGHTDLTAAVSSTVLQTTGQLIIGGHADLGAVSSTILQATGQIRGDNGLAITSGDTSLQNVSGTSATFSGSIGGANASFANVSSTGRLWVTGTSTMTGLVVTNLTAANCDVKSGAGAFYCGLDATGGGGGGSTSTFDYVMPATGGEHPNANDPGYSKTTGSNWTRISLDFSSTTDETINYAFGLPMDIGLVGTSTFYAWSSVTSTATAAQTWVYSLKYLCSANDTAWDATGSTVNTSTVLSALGDIMLTTFNASTTDFV